MAPILGVTWKMQRDEMAANQSVDTRDVTDFLLQDILTGTLPAGTWLKQIDLEERYDCTRPEVRRALDRMTQKRLVQHIPNRGYQVHVVDERRSQEISDIRVILETSVAHLMIAHATPEAIEALRALARRFDDMSFRGSILEHYDANLAFHRALLELARNRELVELVSEIRQRTVSAPVSQWRTRARIEQSAHEHHLMVDALEAGDLAELKRLIEIHIRQAPPKA